MVQFVIYTYEFRKLNNPIEPSLFPEDVDADKTFSEKQQILDSFLCKDFDLKFELNNEELNYKHILHKSGFTVLRIANHKTKKGEFNFEEVDFETYPSVMILIDNRKDVQHIAIQKKGEAFSNTDTVANILTKTLCKLLFPYKLEIDIKHKTFVSGFWNIVEKLNYNVDRLEICFPPPNLPRVSNLIQNIAEESEALQGTATTTFEAPDNNNLFLQKDNPFIENILRVCSDTGYDVRLRSSITHATFSVSEENPAVIETMEEKMFVQLQSYNEDKEPELFDVTHQLIQEWMTKIKTFYA